MMTTYFFREMKTTLYQRSWLFLYLNIIQIKNNKKLVQMSCTAYIVYTFQLTLHHANFGQFEANRFFGKKKKKKIFLILET